MKKAEREAKLAPKRRPPSTSVVQCSPSETRETSISIRTRTRERERSFLVLDLSVFEAEVRKIRSRVMKAVR